MSTPSTPKSSAGDPFLTRSPTIQRSDGGQRPFPPGRLASRRGSTSSTVSNTSTSIGGSLDPAVKRDGPLYESNNTSIASILQPSIVRPGMLPHTHATLTQSSWKAPTTKDIPPVTLTNIPHVPDSYFDDYVNRIGPLFEQYKSLVGISESSSQGGREGQADVRKGGHGSPILSRNSSFSSVSAAEASPRPVRRTSGQLRRGRNEPTPLSVVPSVYFDEEFRLENPRTFDVVSENAELVRPPPGVPAIAVSAANGELGPPRKTLASNAILQEKLSWYMDTVEVHLINNIGSASSGFFSALDSLKELQEEATQSVQKIQSLRRDLKKLDEEVALRGLALAAKTRRAANMKTLGKATAQIETVVGYIDNAKVTIDENRLDEAIDVVDNIAYSMCGLTDSGHEQDGCIDMRGLKVFQDLMPDLRQMHYRIGAGYAKDFTTTLMEDVTEHVNGVQHTDTLRRWLRQRGIQPVYMNTNQALRGKLASTLKGLQRVHHIGTATASYQECVTKEMKNLIRKHLPSSNDEDAESMVSTSTAGGRQLNQQQKSSILARNLRAMDPEDAEQLFTLVYTSISEALRRVSIQTKVLLDVASSLEPATTFAQTAFRDTSQGVTTSSNGIYSGPNPTQNIMEELTQTLDINDLLGRAVDTAQGQIIRVLKVRNEQTIHLPRDDFLRYFHLNRMFADECEGISGRGGQAIRGLITSQILGFVQAFGATEVELVSNMLDKDEWNAVDFTKNDEQVLQRLVSSMTSDPPTWSNASAGILTNGVHKANSDTVPNESQDVANATTTKSATTPAYIEDTRYITVASVVFLLGTVEKILSLTAEIPALTPAIANSLLEVLRVFNSRSCQLILGAGATRSAGLKNITTKHLALASQALSLIIALIPYIRECVRRHLPAGQTAILAEFDKTKRLYQDHQTGIHDKLVEIMTSRCQAHVKAMRTTNFDVEDADNKPSPYMETLTKETLTLHRVLSRHLSEIDVSMIIRQIAAGYQAQWTAAYGEINVQSSIGKARLLRDVECLDNRLGKIEGFADISKTILELVRKKTSVKDQKDVATHGGQVNGQVLPVTKLNGKIDAIPEVAASSQQSGKGTASETAANSAGSEAVNGTKTEA